MISTEEIAALEVACEDPKQEPVDLVPSGNDSNQSHAELCPFIGLELSVSIVQQCLATKSILSYGIRDPKLDALVMAPASGSN